MEINLINDFELDRFQSKSLANYITYLSEKFDAERIRMTKMVAKHLLAGEIEQSEYNDLSSELIRLESVPEWWNLPNEKVILAISGIIQQKIRKTGLHDDSNNLLNLFFDYVINNVDAYATQPEFKKYLNSIKL